MQVTLQQWFKNGAPWVWLNAGAVASSLILLTGSILLIAWHGLGHFWIQPVYQFQYQDKGQILKLAGEIVRQQTMTVEQLGFNIKTNSKIVKQILLKTGNRELYGLDFKWLLAPHVISQILPPNIVTIERQEWGNFYGFIVAIKENNQQLNIDPDKQWQQIQQRLDRTRQLQKKIKTIEKKDIQAINYALEKLRLKTRQFELKNQPIPASMEVAKQTLNTQYHIHLTSLNTLRQQINRDKLLVTSVEGNTQEIDFVKIVQLYQANTLSILTKIKLYFVKVWIFLSADPREANTEGGVFPAIFGTIVMVLLMTVFVTPLGVITAIYLHEYAKQSWLTRLIRVAVNNLAGVPSVVYGVFGLGFFVYTLGGNIDSLFFPEALPAPTFGTPGLLWASLTLALLTLPVVIVSTEEGLSRIPKNLRDASLALGSTQAESLWRVILPMTSPAIITGLILAVARAAGEVAPLMLVGVVKLAPTLAVDTQFPFLHLERKFMHLGFHIYDVGFQSPNVEAARPLVYATALLLIAIIIMLNLSAVVIRNHLREKYKLLDS